MKIVFLMFLSMFVIDGVFGVDPDGVKTVIEGDSVTLQTDFTEMQKDGLTEWKVNNTNIATLSKGTGKVEYSDDKLMFSGRLNLDQTGFLTIWNIRIKHSGEYKVESISSVGTKSKTFKVIVKKSPLKSVEDKDEIKVLSATKGSSETLHTETELQKHDLILWRFGDEGSLIAKADTEDIHASYYGDDGRFKGRLELDSKTGSLTVTDLETEHTGEFRLKIISDRRILFKRFTVSVSVLGLSPGAVAGMFGVVVLLFAATAVASSVMVFSRGDHFKLKNRMSKITKQLLQMSKMTKQLDQMTKTNEKDLAKISEQINKMDKDDVSEYEKKELCRKLKRMLEDYEKALPEVSKQLERLRDQKIPERLLELSEEVNQMNEPETSQQESCADVPQEERPRSEIREDDVVISEQETRANVTQEETPRREIRGGERERIFCVEETPRSKALGTDKRLRGRRGKKSIVIRKTNTEDAGVHTHGSDGKAPENELKELKEESSGKVNEETPLMSRKEDDGSNE